MNTFTIEDIRSYNPCYDPGKYLPEDWQGTALDILKVDAAPAEDRFWLVLREGWIDDKTLRLFAVWCAREVLTLTANPDPRSVAACDVAERFANGNVTEEELAAAWAAAWDATRAAAGSADWDATRAAAWAAAWDATRSAAWAAAWAAACDADRAAAGSAAGSAAWVAQWRHLVEMLENQ